LAYDSFAELRQYFESNDPFMYKGHRISKKLQRERDVPSWTLNNSQTKKVLLRSFPNLLGDPKQRIRAGRWLRVIDLFFRQNWSQTDVAAELKMSYDSVHTLLRNIRRAGDGLRCDGTGKLSLKKGRPRRGKTCPPTGSFGGPHLK
jgi:hypothetical protein